MSVHRRLLLSAGGSGSFATPAPTTLYALFNGQDGSGAYAIGAATFASSAWSQDGSNPILSAGAAATWDDGHVKDPCLLWDGSQYVVYYSGYDGATYRIGRATAAAHGGPWTKYASNPVLTVGAGGAFDDAGANFPTVLYEPSDTGKEWKCWYAANDGSTQTIGYAHSSDGLTWTKVGMVLNVGTGGSWDDVGVLPMAIAKSGSTYYLWYGGRANTVAPVNWQGGLATFTDPEGTYTRSGSNPVLAKSGGTSGISQALTGDTLSGSSIVAVATTSHWVAGMPMLIADGNSESEYHTIASIDSGTQVTLNSVVTSNFTTAQGAVIRPFDINSVTPRSVLSAGGTTYQMFYAAFQPQDDLSTGGTQLREASMRATGSSLTGTWTPVYSEGLLFPLFPATSAWNKFSAENPSVIVAP